MFQICCSAVLSVAGYLWACPAVIFLYKISLKVILTLLLLPWFFVLFPYFMTTVHNIHRMIQKLRGVKYTPETDFEYWEWSRRFIAKTILFIGRTWVATEFVGLENLPRDSAALIVAYHGPCPIDVFCTMMKIFLDQHRLLLTVCDSFLFKFPGWKTISKVWKATADPPHKYVEALQQGNLLLVAPGGVYEARFGKNYELMWRGRKGFAKMAIAAKVPIIPMFTENICEMINNVPIGRTGALKLYEKYKIVCRPIYGGFPVKLRTHFGKPIEYDPNVSAEELCKKTADAIEELMRKHQRKPGSVFHAILDRF